MVTGIMPVTVTFLVQEILATRKMTIREKILGLIAGIACIVAVVAVQDDVTARKSRDTYKERCDSVKGLLWYVPDEQWGIYVKERLKKFGNEPYDTNADD